MICVTGDIFSVGSLGMITAVIDTEDTTIESALFTLLSGDAAVASYVSSRIYPNVIPQNAAMPAIAYQQISGPRDQVMDAPDELLGARFQINCRAETNHEGRLLSEAVRKALNGYKGTVNSREIQGIFLLDEGDIPAITPDTEQLRRFGKRLDFMVWYKEALT